jgi:hypothetical protein
VEEFEKRFQQFTAIEPVVAFFFVNPLACQIEVTELLHLLEDSFKQGQKNWNWRFWTFKTMLF